MGSKHNASINGRNASIISRKSYVGVVTACWSVETESESTQAGATSTGNEPSLLDRLKAPMRSELTRKRVIRKNLSNFR